MRKKILFSAGLFVLPLAWSCANSGNKGEDGQETAPGEVNPDVCAVLGKACTVDTDCEGDTFCDQHASICLPREIFGLTGCTGPQDCREPYVGCMTISTGGSYCVSEFILRCICQNNPGNARFTGACSAVGMGGGGSGAEPVPCGEKGEACDANRACCEDLVCVQSAIAEFSGCREPCTEDSDCESNCCILFTGSTDGFCVAAEYCACVAEGGVCDGSVPCCKGLTCIRFSESGDYTCQPECTSDDQCASGQCRIPEGDISGGCLPL
jgi:hypothetical protein